MVSYLPIRRGHGLLPFLINLSITVCMSFTVSPTAGTSSTNISDTDTAGWYIIASDIGGSPLGVSFFEDGLTGVTATSEIVPFPGYFTKVSTNGGYNWSSVPDQDLFIFGLYNSAVYGNNAVISAMEFIQYSNTKGNHFNASSSSGTCAGGEIVRLLHDINNLPCGFAILGQTNSGNVNGIVVSYDGGVTFKPINIPEWDPDILSIDGVFFNSTWIVGGNQYVTGTTLNTAAADKPSGISPPKKSLHSSYHHRRSPTTRLQYLPNDDSIDSRSSGRYVPTYGKVDSTKGAYDTQIIISNDAGSTWTTVYRNKTVALLGIACIDTQNCCFVGENAEYAFIYCTNDGFQTTYRGVDDNTQGAALVEIAVGMYNNQTCYIAVGGYVSASGDQGPVFYRSCNFGKQGSWSTDPLPSWPVANLLVTDIDCQTHTANGTSLCSVTLWDNDVIEPNGYVARYFP